MTTVTAASQTEVARLLHTAGLSKRRAARLLGVNTGTLRRWAEGDPAPGWALLELTELAHRAQAGINDGKEVLAPR